jgi:hypothetical protein
MERYVVEEGLGRSPKRFRVVATSGSGYPRNLPGVSGLTNPAAMRLANEMNGLVNQIETLKQQMKQAHADAVAEARSI